MLDATRRTPLAGIVGAVGVHERSFKDLLHRADLAAPPVPVREPCEQARNRRVVADRLKGRQSAVDLVRDLVDAALCPDEQADQRRGETSGNRAASVAGLLGRRDRRRVHVVGA
jgi:hypothetical protein